MATPLFRVDLSHGARDYEHMATEPGLPMLDPQSVNFRLLSSWLGDLVAEPHWETDSSVVFFARDGQRGRLSQVECAPATKADMEKLLQDDLQRMQARLRKVKPQSTTEKLLLEIVKKSIQGHLADLDAGDFDSFFFKVREGKSPWRLVWCWGYQRTDLQPSPAHICRQPDCYHLFVRRPKTRAICPLCDTAAQRKTGLAGLRVPLGALLALAVLVLLFLLLFPAKLQVSPGQWTGPAGSRVDFQVRRTRWLFFTEDVTQRVVAQSHDPRVLEFAPHGASAQAKNMGQTWVSFLYQDLAASVAVQVAAPSPPDSLALRPSDFKLAVGSTQRLRAIGIYGESEADVSDLVTWTVAQTELVDVRQGRAEGKVVGKTTILAEYPAAEEKNSLQVSANVEVVDVDFKSLAVRLSPDSFGVGQTSRVDIMAEDADGEEYSLSGSSRVAVRVKPPTIAGVEQEYLVGRSAGEGSLEVAMGELAATESFAVTDSSSVAGVFSVAPQSLEMLMYESFTLDVVNGTGQPVVAESSDPAIVEVLRPRKLAGRAAGEAVVTLTCGQRQQTINVTVHEVDIQGIRFDPEVVSLRVGESQILRVYAMTETGRAIELAADQLEWLSQPLSEYAAFDRESLRISGLRPTDRPQDLEARFQGDHTAIASLEVVGTGVDELVGLESNAWLAHPPIGGVGRVVAAGPLVGSGLRYNGDRVVVAGDVSPFSPLGSLPSGAEIIRVNGDDLTRLSAEQVGGYFETHPLVDGDVLEYRDLAGNTGSLLLGGTLDAFQDFKVLGFSPQGVRPDDFSIDVRLLLRLAGKYRLSLESGDSLSPWQDVGENQVVVMSTGAIKRNPEDDYEIFLDREIDSVIKRFQITFKLDASNDN